MKKILFTGGHHTPAVSVIQQIRKQKLDFELVWVGHKYSMINDISESAEYKEITALSIKFLELKASKMYRNINLSSILKFLKSLYYSLKIIHKERPDLIVSFGGYLAVPIVFIARLYGIKIISHEQTRSSGFANRVIAFFANEILLTWPTSTRFYQRFKSKTSIVGLPVRRNIFEGEKLNNINPELLTVYITGGKQGSHTINLIIEQSLDFLLQHFNVIHQVGSNSYYKDFDRMKNLGIGNNGKYIIQEFIGQSEIGSVFKTADIVITRGGANTIYELGLLGKPAIIIPITKSSHNEQFENAKFLEENGSAIIISEEQFTTELLIKSLESIKSNFSEYINHAQKINTTLTKDADIKITEKISNWVSKTS